MIECDTELSRRIISCRDQVIADDHIEEFRDRVGIVRLRTPLATRCLDLLACRPCLEQL